MGLYYNRCAAAARFNLSPVFGVVYLCGEGPGLSPGVDITALLEPASEAKKNRQNGRLPT
jgi:hypothetical protein